MVGLQMLTGYWINNSSDVYYGGCGVCTIQLTDVCDKQSLMFGTETDVLWYRPSSLKELLSLKERHRHARLVSGATSIGQSISFFIFF